MAFAFELMAKLGLDSDEFDEGLKKSGNRAKDFAARAEKARKVITGMALAGAGAVVAFAGASLKTGMQFDSAMSQVAATMGTTVDNIQNLRDYAKEMGAATAFSATQAAEAMNYMALAGYDAETTMKMLPNVLNLAAAGGIDLAYASDMITDSQSALGLTLDQTTELVDKMAKTASKSNTSVQQLGEAFLTVGGTAKNLSGGTTELSTALGILADNGIKGSEGGTALRNMILSLSAPTDKASKLMQDLGLQVFDAEGKMRPLKDVFGDLNDALSTMTQEERTNVLSELFNKVDLKSANALLGTTAERWDELSGAIDNASGAAQQMADTQLDNLAGDITLLKSAFEGLQISVSDKLSPAARVAVQALTELVNNAGSIATAILPAVAAFATFAVAINIGPIVTSLTTAVQGFFAVLAANPIGLAIALMAGLAVATYNLVTHFSELYTEADKAAEGIRNLNRATESGVSGWVEQENAAKESMDGVQSSVESAVSGVSDTLGSAGADSGQAYRDNLTQALSGIDSELASQVGAAMDGSIAAVDSASAQMGEAGSNAVSEYAGAWQNGEVNSAVSSAMSDAVSTAGEVTAQFQNVGQNISQQLSASIAAGAAIVSSAVRGVIQTAIVVGNSATAGARAIGQNIARGIAAGISAGSGAIAAAARSAVQAAVAAAKAAAAISSPSKLFRDEVGYFMGLGVAAGLEDAEDETTKAAVKLARDTYSKAKEWIRRTAKMDRWSLQDELNTWIDVQAGFNEGSQQWLDAEEAIFDIREKMADEFYSDEEKRIERDIKRNNRSVVEQIQMWADLQSRYEKTSEEYVKIDDKIFDLRMDLARNFENETEKLWKNIADAQEKFDDKLESRIESIAGAYDLFSDVQDRTVISAEEVTTNLLRQVNVLGDFYDSLDALSARGVSEQMVNEIREMGPQAIDQLQALLSMTDDQLTRYSELYGEKQRIANEQAERELAGFKSETESTIRENLDNLIELYEEDGPTIGEALTTGITDGIKRGMSTVVDAAIDMAESTVEAIKGKLGLDSGELQKVFTTSKIPFSASGLGVSSAGIINNAVAQSDTKQEYTLNLTMADGSVMAKWMFNPLKDYAAAKGQPIVNAG